MREAGAGRPVRLVAPAKLTLSLRVTGVLDDGYHQLEALASSVDGLEDHVEVALLADPQIALSVAGLTDGVPRDDDNLAVAAARMLLRRVEPGAGARLRIRKGIPARAGLGGGSTDAAAVLHGVARLLPDETAGVSLEEVGASLGSDVPFCVRGGLAWMRGRGEVLESLDPVDGWWAVVAVPPFGVSTPEVYAAWDRLEGPRAIRTVPAPEPVAGLLPELANDLEAAACAVEPALAEFRDAVEDAAGRPAVLAGSGSAWFVPCDDEDEAARAAAALDGVAETVAVCQPSPGVRPIAG